MPQAERAGGAHAFSVKAPFLAAAALWVAAAALIVHSVLDGGATVTLVIIVPVVSGSSAEFLVGVALLIAGFVLLWFSFAYTYAEPETPPAPPSGTGSSVPGGAGGVVLIGPVPIVFGSWRGISRRARWLLALVGALVLIVVVLAAAGLLR
jgi:uncharacterized protein (TIGR00304 family)